MNILTRLQQRFVFGFVLCIIFAAGTLMVGSRAYADCTPGPDVVCDGNNNPNPDVDNQPAGDGSVTNNGDTPGIYNAPDGDGTVNNSGTSEEIVNEPDGDGTVNNSGTSDLIVNVPGEDGTVNNSGTSEEIVNLTNGDGTVNNSGTVIIIINDAGGDGVVNNSGTAEVIVNTACGDVTVNNSGTVGDIINATCTGTATTIISGTVEGDVINSGAVNNQVILQDGAVVNGVIDGDDMDGTGDSTLVFNMSVDELYYDDIAQQIANANPNGGWIVINGHTYRWENFTQLKNLLRKLRHCFANDGRINDCDPEQTITGYCTANGGLNIYAVNESKGSPTLEISKQQIAAALEKAKTSEQNILIASKDGRELWALASGELQMHDSRAEALHGAPYDHVFAGQRCG